jgi:hypothetical protein
MGQISISSTMAFTQNVSHTFHWYNANREFELRSRQMKEMHPKLPVVVSFLTKSFRSTPLHLCRTEYTKNPWLAKKLWLIKISDRDTRYLLVTLEESPYLVGPNLLVTLEESPWLVGSDLLVTLEESPWLVGPDLLVTLEESPHLVGHDLLVTLEESP